jgi:hypothetical protein
MHSQGSTQRLPQPPSGQGARCVVRARENPSRTDLLRAETLFRELNEAIQLYFRADGEMRADFVCECSDVSCVDPIRLSPSEYADIRAHPTRFFVTPDHEDEKIERVVEQNGHFLVVEKPVVP